MGVVIAAMMSVRALRLFPSDEAHDIPQMFIIFQWAALCSWIVWTTTFWVLRRNRQWLLLSLTQNMQHIDLVRAASSSPSPSPTTTPHSPNNDSDNACVMNLQMSEVLRDNNGLEAFMMHMAHEFSSEIVLCVIELTQFQHALSHWWRHTQ